MNNKEIRKSTKIIKKPSEENKDPILIKKKSKIGLTKIPTKEEKKTELKNQNSIVNKEKPLSEKINKEYEKKISMEPIKKNDDNDLNNKNIDLDKNETIFKDSKEIKNEKMEEQKNQVDDKINDNDNKIFLMEGIEDKVDKEKKPKVKIFDENEEKKKLKAMKDSERFMTYLQEKGISIVFQVVYSEIISKNIPKEDVFKYTAKRLRQIGADLQMIKNKRL